MDVSDLGHITSLKQVEGSDSALSKFAEDFDDFLQLLIVQLQNQDPTSPLETNDFMQQLVSFTGVEQEINTNTKLDELIALQSGVQTSNLVSFTGKDVEVEGNLVTLEDEGDVTFAYNIDEEVDNVFVTVKNFNDQVVFTAEATKVPGRNTVTWEGNDNDGNRLPKGLYQVFVSTSKGENIIEQVQPLVQGRVLGVNLEAEPPTLIVNGEEIPLDEVKFIGDSALLGA